jgi:hypothetical protein
MTVMVLRVIEDRAAYSTRRRHRRGSDGQARPTVHRSPTTVHREGHGEAGAADSRP